MTDKEYEFINSLPTVKDIALVMSAYYREFKKRLTSEKFRELLQMRDRI